jgi:hypothetical protein
MLMARDGAGFAICGPFCGPGLAGRGRGRGAFKAPTASGCGPVRLPLIADAGPARDRPFLPKIV